MHEPAFSQASADYKRIEKAIGFIEANCALQPDLDQMAAAANLSKYHFHRLFKRWVGIGPAQFLRHLTLAQAKSGLTGEESVLNVALDTGLSGPSRLHDLFVTFDAVTPGEFKRKGADLTIAYDFHPTPFGECLLAMTDRGICYLGFVSGDDRFGVFQHLRDSWPKATMHENGSKGRKIIERLFQPAKGAGNRPFHLHLRGTNFQVNVWRALLTIPPGSLAAYRDIAARIGRPGSARAVGGAVAANPVAYLIPCHRVIAATGGLAGYRWGRVRKQAMIGWEAVKHASMP